MSVAIISACAAPQIVVSMSTSDGCNDNVSKSKTNNDDVCEVNDMLQNTSAANDNNDECKKRAAELGLGLDR